MRIYRAAWTQDWIDFKGRFFQIRDVSLDPNPTAAAMPLGYNTLITVYTRTGHVTSHPIDPLGLIPNSKQNPTTWNPFRFTQDGLTSGNAGN